MRFSRIMLATALSVCATAASATPPSATGEISESRQGEEHETALLRVNTPLWEGEFSAEVEPLPDQNAARIVLTGKMWEPGHDAKRIPSDSWDAKLTFVFDNHSSDIDAMGPLRTWRIGDSTELYSADPIAPHAAIWTQKTEPQLGSIEVWNGETENARLSDGMVLSLFHAMILPADDGEEGQRVMACTPPYNTCLSNAKSTCNHGVASFQYHCEEGSVTCEFSCLAPAPDPDPDPQ